jgi:hypothetical protein
VCSDRLLVLRAGPRSWTPTWSTCRPRAGRAERRSDRGAGRRSSPGVSLRGARRRLHA